MSRVVLVLGASSGIGRAAAHELAAAGDHLVLASRGLEALRRTAEECAGAASVTIHAVDVSDGDAVQRLVDDVIAEHRRLDAVIHSAGVVAYGRFEDIPAEVYDAVLATNVKGPANVARAVLPVMRAQKQGTLVIIGSVLGNINVPLMTPYIVSKWAIRSFGRQLALENRDLPQVRISVVSPGSVDTPIYRQAANYMGRAGRPPAPVDSAAKVAHAAVGALDKPKDRIGVGLANPLMRLGFSVLPGVFDVIVGPIFRMAALKPGTQDSTAGNVLAPQDVLEQVDGGEGQGLKDIAGRLTGH